VSVSGVSGHGHWQKKGQRGAQADTGKTEKINFVRCRSSHCKRQQLTGSSRRTSRFYSRRVHSSAVHIIVSAVFLLFQSIRRVDTVGGGREKGAPIRFRPSIRHRTRTVSPSTAAAATSRGNGASIAATHFRGGKRVIIEAFFRVGLLDRGGSLGGVVTRTFLFVGSKRKRKECGFWLGEILTPQERPDADCCRLYS
jgi:hypothetical protein